MFLMLLSAIDVIAGLCLLGSVKGILATVIGIIILIKGLFSVIGGVATKHYLDWMGWIDLIAGLSLIFGFFIPYFWILPILKGTYSFLTGF